MVARPTYLPKPFADLTVDKNIIPENPPPGLPGNASLDTGFPPITKLPSTSGGLPPLQEDFNGALNQLYQFAQWQQAGGQALWDVRVNEYPVNTIVFGSNGIRYQCIQANGSATTAEDPVNDIARLFWKLLSGEQDFVVNDIASLRLISGGRSAEVLGYYTAGDGGGGPTRIWNQGAGQIDDGGATITTGLGVPSIDGAWIWGDISETSLGDWGGIADGNNANVTVDTAAVLNAFAYCGANRKQLYIPKKHWVLNELISISSLFDIRCDSNAIFRWIDTTPGKSGITFDFTTIQQNLRTINLPGLLSPVHAAGIGIPGYNAGAGWNYDLSSRIETAVKIRGGDRINYNIQYINGWESAVHLAPQAGRILANVNINVNTIDFCVKGFNIDTSETGNLAIAQVVTKVNTVWAKFPLYFNTPASFVQSSKFEVTGGALVNENGGCVIYGEGVNVRSNTIVVNWANAGERQDSVPATPVGLVCPYLGGDQTSNGLSNDGMGVSSDIGYFGGEHNDISIGTSFNFATQGSASSPVPSAGDTIRIRDAGDANITKVLYADYDSNGAGNPIPVGDTIGEANYNGGVGGAQYAENVYSSVALTALAAGASINKFIYYQPTSPDREKPFLIMPKDVSILDNNIDIIAFQDTSENRLVRLRITNRSAVSFTGSLFFWLGAR